MPDPLRAVAFDFDAASLTGLREALPEWHVAAVNGAAAASRTHDWSPWEADLLVVNAREEVAEIVGLCRFLVLCNVFLTDPLPEVAEALGLRGGRKGQDRNGGAPLLVLVPPGQEPLMRVALEAGADSCLVLPVQTGEVASMLAHTSGKAPGRKDTRHTATEPRMPLSVGRSCEPVLA